MFINTEPVPPVYCRHGSNHSLNKQLLCLPAPVSGPRSQERQHPAPYCFTPSFVADNGRKGVGLDWEQLLGFCPVFCLLWRGCFQATSCLLSAIRAAIADYLAQCVSSAFSQASGAQILEQARQTLREAQCCRTFGPL